jgi:hypothetical protein
VFEIKEEEKRKAKEEKKKKKLEKIEESKVNLNPMEQI